jgi:hypothetical protein
LNDLHFRALFLERLDFDLFEDDFDAFGVVVWDEFCVSDLVDKWFAASCKVVNIECSG